MPPMSSLWKPLLSKSLLNPTCWLTWAICCQYAEAAKTYPFVTDVGTHDGVTKAFAYQATPGALFYRRSLAKEYFGTDDPAEIQELLVDFDKFTEAAAVVKEKSGGDTYMVASSGDFQNPFFANRAQPWIVDDTLVVDPMVEEYVDTAKTVPRRRL